MTAPSENERTLQRVALRGETPVRVKELAGYRKGAPVPDRVTPAFVKTVGKLAEAELNADVERHFQLIREKLGYKRREVEVALAEDGRASIHTPDFAYHVAIDLADDPATALLRREVSDVRSEAVLRSPAFRDVFGATFDTLVFAFPEPPDIARIVDDIEDRDLPGVKVTCPSQCTWAEIELPRLSCSVRIDSQALAIHERAEASAGALVDTFFSLREFFAGERVRMLPS